MAIELSESVANMLQQHALNGAQRMSDGASLYAENLRYSYLISKDRLSFTECQALMRRCDAKQPEPPIEPPVATPTK